MCLFICEETKEAVVPSVEEVVQKKDIQQKAVDLNDTLCKTPLPTRKRRRRNNFNIDEVLKRKESGECVTSFAATRCTGSQRKTLGEALPTWESEIRLVQRLDKTPTTRKGNYVNQDKLIAARMGIDDPKTSEQQFKKRTQLRGQTQPLHSSDVIVVNLSVILCKMEIKNCVELGENPA